MPSLLRSMIYYMAFLDSFSTIDTTPVPIEILHRSLYSSSGSRGGRYIIIVPLWYLENNLELYFYHFCCGGSEAVNFYLNFSDVNESLDIAREQAMSSNQNRLVEIAG